MHALKIWNWITQMNVVETLLQRLFDTHEDDTLPDNTRKHNQYKKMILQTNKSL